MSPPPHSGATVADSSAVTAAGSAAPAVAPVRLSGFAFSHTLTLPGSQDLALASASLRSLEQTAASRTASPASDSRSSSVRSERTQTEVDVGGQAPPLGPQLVLQPLVLHTAPPAVQQRSALQLADDLAELAAAACLPSVSPRLRAVLSEYGVLSEVRALLARRSDEPRRRRHGYAAWRVRRRDTVGAARQPGEVEPLRDGRGVG